MYWTDRCRTRRARTIALYEKLARLHAIHGRLHCPAWWRLLDPYRWIEIERDENSGKPEYTVWLRSGKETHFPLLGNCVAATFTANGDVFAYFTVLRLHEAKEGSRIYREVLEDINTKVNWLWRKKCQT